MPKIGNHLFTTYCLYYKEKLKIIDSRYNPDLFYKSDYSSTFFHTCNDGV